jgi:hypothetical protein
LDDLVEPVSLATSGLSNPGELANPAASVPLTKKSLRFMLPSLHSLPDKSFRNRFPQSWNHTIRHPCSVRSGNSGTLHLSQEQWKTF